MATVDPGELAWRRRWAKAFPTLVPHLMDVGPSPATLPVPITKLPYPEEFTATTDNMDHLWWQRLAWRTFWDEYTDDRSLPDVASDDCIPNINSNSNNTVSNANINNITGLPPEDPPSVLRNIATWNQSLGYGEITAEATWTLVRTIQPYLPSSQSLTAVDLGSGNGKVLLAAAFAYPFRKLVGLELLPGLHEDALRYQAYWQQRWKGTAASNTTIPTTLGAAAISTTTTVSNLDPSTLATKSSETGALSPAVLEFYCDDFTNSPNVDWIHQADVVFCHATVFQTKLLERLQVCCEQTREGTLFCMVTKPLQCNARIETLAEIRLDMSWGRAAVYVQRRRIHHRLPPTETATDLSLNVTTTTVSTTSPNDQSAPQATELRANADSSDRGTNCTRHSMASQKRPMPTSSTETAVAQKKRLVADSEATLAESALSLNEVPETMESPPHLVSFEAPCPRGEPREEKVCSTVARPIGDEYRILHLDDCPDLIHQVGGAVLTCPPDLESMLWEMGDSVPDPTKLTGQQQYNRVSGKSSMSVRYRMYDGSNLQQSFAASSNTRTEKQFLARCGPSLDLFDAVLRQFVLEQKFCKSWHESSTMKYRFSVMFTDSQAVPQNAHIDYQWDDLDGSDPMPYLGFLPLTKAGMFLQLWTGNPDDGVIKMGNIVFVPWGKLLLVPGNTVHGGGFRTGNHGNLRAHFYIHFGVLKVNANNHYKNRYGYDLSLTHLHNPSNDFSKFWN
ncbi:predicted protein [Phaeodactylum tricornutum CCAP 1055/1]|uniref:Histone H3-K79 methyltransferase n=1 Tax=Phaeodactylum tricornutum (strain CCAP 1055/1) TaxID=556484 RepID=B7G3M7_PHATC|nr:predicted protein [Phaeodactylum tricornutum CCAP 1055/1]EEC47032.1 predicted protein [Phaeodactylum tricornutum CCAP 1055/1]|eukprot:XP_002181818.1 predicted protein [Phaeodactylum tricornutum CCAP 1055/1]